MRSKAIILALATVLWTFTATSALGDGNTIDTIASWDGSTYIQPFGYPNTATYGQVITAPAGANRLDSFAFEMKIPATTTFRGFVYAWDGNKATGPALYESADRNTSGASAFQLVSFNTGGVAVTPGSRYVIFGSTSKSNGSDNGQWGRVDPGTYAGGSLVFRNNGTDESLWTTSNWETFVSGDMAFRAVFNQSGSSNDDDEEDTWVMPADPRVGWGFASATSGGYMASRDGRLGVGVDGGVYDVDLQMAYTPADNWEVAPPACQGYVGLPFDVHVTPFTGGQPIMSFLKPITLVANYQDGETGNFDVASLRIARFDGSWSDLPSVVDQTAKTVTAQTSSSGRYALTGRLKSCAGGTGGAAAVQAVPAGSSVSGKVFYDRNGNGAMDGDDFPVAQAGVKLSSALASSFTTTAADGSYSFGGLQQGVYAVELSVGPEWASTTSATVGGLYLSGAPEHAKADANFGIWLKAQ